MKISITTILNLQAQKGGTIGSAISHLRKIGVKERYVYEWLKFFFRLPHKWDPENPSIFKKSAPKAATISY